jgi:hypothetical protein
MLPLQDLNPARRFPILTYTLIVINVFVLGMILTRLIMIFAPSLQ